MSRSMPTQPAGIRQLMRSPSPKEMPPPEKFVRIGLDKRMYATDDATPFRCPQVKLGEDGLRVLQFVERAKQDKSNTVKLTRETLKELRRSKVDVEQYFKDAAMRPPSVDSRSSKMEEMRKRRSGRLHEDSPSSSRSNSMAPSSTVSSSRRDSSITSSAQKKKIKMDEPFMPMVCAQCNGLNFRVVASASEPSKNVIECMRRRCLASYGYTTVPVGTVMQRDPNYFGWFSENQAKIHYRASNFVPHFDYGKPRAENRLPRDERGHVLIRCPGQKNLVQML